MIAKSEEIEEIETLNDMIDVMKKDMREYELRYMKYRSIKDRCIQGYRDRIESLQAKLRKMHECEANGVRCYSRETGALWLRTVSPEGIPSRVYFCPICGEKSEE